MNVITVLLIDVIQVQCHVISIITWSSNTRNELASFSLEQATLLIVLLSSL